MCVLGDETCDISLGRSVGLEIHFGYRRLAGRRRGEAFLKCDDGVVESIGSRNGADWPASDVLTTFKIRGMSAL